MHSSCSGVPFVALCLLCVAALTNVGDADATSASGTNGIADWRQLRAKGGVSEEIFMCGVAWVGIWLHNLLVMILVDRMAWRKETGMQLRHKAMQM